MKSDDGSVGKRRDELETRLYERLTFVRAVHVIVLLALVLTLGAAVMERLVEPQTFPSFGDAAWWAIATVSTTGYGDLAPHTAAGRVVGSLVMVCALAWVPAVTAIVMTLHVRRREERRLMRHGNADQQVAFMELAVRLDRVERLLGDLGRLHMTSGSQSTADTQREVIERAG